MTSVPPAGGLRRHRLRQLFAPRSIAIVGASGRRDSISNMLFSKLREGGFAGPIIPVSRNHPRVWGRRAVDGLHSLEDGRLVDLAILVVPADQVGEVVEQGAVAGIRNFVIISSGFAEEGPNGRVRQAALQQLGQSRDLAILGPNTVGFINRAAHVHATFAPWARLERSASRTAVISQSGGIAGTIEELGRRGGLTFRYVIGSGNEALLDVCDYVDYVAADPHVDTIAIYMESLRRGRRFLATAVRLRAQSKRLVVLVGGRYAGGARAAISHTAAIATSGRVLPQLLQQAGIVVVDTPEEVAAALQLLAGQRKPPQGRRLLLMANSGGYGVLGTDMAEECGHTVPELQGARLQAVQALLPSYASAKNPIDPTPAVGLNPQRMAEVLGVAAGADDIDAVFVCSSLPGRGPERMAAATAQALRGVDKYSFVGWFAGSKAISRTYARHGIPYVDDVRVALRSLNRLIAAESAAAEQLTSPLESADYQARVKSSTSAILTEDRIGSILRDAGFPVVPHIVVRDRKAARMAASEFGFPVVIKALSSQVPHRKKLGAMAIGLTSPRELDAAYARIESALITAGATLEAMLVQPQLPASLEVLIGIHVDEAFGPILIIGPGGDVAEQAFATVATPLPTSARVISSMLASEQHRIGAWLGGSKITDLATLCSKLGEWWLGSAEPLALVELDLNPVMFSSKGPVIVDALAVAASPAGNSAHLSHLATP